MWEFLVATARRVPERVALIEGDGTVSTYAQLWGATERVARFLQTDANVAKGERIAITAQGTREFLAAMYGALLAGGVVVPLNPLLREGEFYRQLSDAGVAVVLASFPSRTLVESLLRKGALPALRRIYPLEELGELTRATSGAPEPVDINVDEDLAVIPYSSGTEGVPTGAMYTHESMAAAIYQRTATWDCNETSMILDLGPKWTAIRGILATGATVVEPTVLGPEGCLDMIEQRRVTHILARPFAVEQLVRAYERRPRDVSSVRYVETGGTPLPPAVSRRATDVFGVPIGQSYRLNGGNTSNRTVRADVRAGSVGPPVPDAEERIVDPVTGEDVPRGEVGELWVRGPHIMRGYWGQAEATARVLLPGGWFRTGDVARADADGHVYIVDRMKELMKVYGRSVAPAEIEAVLLEHPAVSEAAVVPVSSLEAGETPKAFVVPAHQVEASELIAFVKRRLAAFKAPSEVELVPSRPRGATGKVLRRVLIEQERARRRDDDPD